MITDYIDKIKKWKDRVLFRNNLEKSVYNDFTPTDSLKKTDETIKALHWALNNKNIKNIALTGPYGAGKSSIVQSYIKLYKLKNVLDISLATFDEFEEDLEKGILKQLFYKVNADKIPLSRYRKLHHRSLWKYIGVVVIMMLVVLSTDYLIYPNKFHNKWLMYKSVFNSTEYSVKVAIAAGVVVIGVAQGIRYIISKFFIKEISVGDISAKADEISQNSVLDKNIDEMLYFFEKTKYRIVFIEDLDRFNSTSIFIKLREINTIINNYDVIKRRIVFVYAVKDDLFVTETERTKFFDFIIPVIPVINATNSGQIMKDMLGMGKRETNKEYPENNISEEFINLVSTYISDMRILISIVNEFWIYKRKLKESQGVRLKDEQMMAMIIYKNVRPDDFALIEAESGDIKSAFDFKKDSIKKAKEILEQKKTELQNKQQDILNSIKEIKIIILSRLAQDEGVVKYIDINYNSVSYIELLADSYDFNNFRNSQITVYYYTQDNSNRRISYDDIENYSEEMKKLFERYDIQRKYAGKTDEEVIHEIEKIEQEILTLRANTLEELINKSSAEVVLPQDVQENKLLVFLIRHGFINESYADYINNFHEGSISREELNFILSIRNYEGVVDFGYTITHCSNTVDKLFDYEFMQKEALNFDLMHFLLGSKENAGKLKKYVEQLCDGSETSRTFIKEYIDLDKDTHLFLKTVCNKSKYIWRDIEQDEQISQDKKVAYLEKIIISCDIEDIVRNNNRIIWHDEELDGYANEDEEVAYEDKDGIKHYIEEDSLILEKLGNVPIEKMTQVIECLEIEFYQSRLSNVNKEILNFIVSGKYFELNQFMIHEVYNALGGDSEEKLIKQNYSCIYDFGNQDLLKCVHEDFSEYVNTFILNEHDNTEESQQSVDIILNELFDKEPDLCIEVIKKEHLSYWENLSDCIPKIENDRKQELWNYLISNNKVGTNWENYFIYLKQFGLTEELCSFVDVNIEKILSGHGMEDFTDETFLQLISQVHSIETITKLLDVYKVEQFVYSMSVFSEEKLEIMIQKHYFEFSTARYFELHEINTELSIEFIKENKNEFVRSMRECKLELEIIKKILALEFLDMDETKLLLTCFTADEIDEELALYLKNFEFQIEKEYTEAAWNVLKNEDKYELLYNQLEVYELDEIASKFSELGGVYDVFAERTRHKYVLDASDYNRNLCFKLKKMAFLSSVEEADIVTQNDKYEKRITGNVRKG